MEEQKKILQMVYAIGNANGAIGFTMYAPCVSSKSIEFAAFVELS
jgi:hypothetical protein